LVAREEGEYREKQGNTIPFRFMNGGGDPKKAKAEGEKGERVSLEGEETKRLANLASLGRR